MDTTTWIVIGAAVLVVGVLLVVLGMSYRSKREQSHLRETFGTEYDDTYARAMDRKAARGNLKEREERVSSYDLRALTPEERRGFLVEWQAMQATFVDDPNRAVGKADVLLAEVMRARGYGSDLADQQQRIEDVSVGHGDEAQAFREATRIAALNRAGRATTEDLRRAIQHYATVFDSLLNEAEVARR
jgi:hypothetical protein